MWGACIWANCRLLRPWPTIPHNAPILWTERLHQPQGPALWRGYDASQDGIQRRASLPGNHGPGGKSQQRRWWEKRERESTEKAGIQRDRRMCLPRDAKRFVYASATQASLAWLFVPHCSLLWRDVQLACPDRSIGFWVCVDKSGSRAGNETGILLSLYYFIKYKIICIRQNLSDHSNSSVKMCIYILIYIIRVRSGTFYLTIQAQVLILSGGF